MIEIALILISGYIILVAVCAIFGFTIEGVSYIADNKDEIIKEIKETPPISDNALKYWIISGAVIGGIILLIY